VLLGAADNLDVEVRIVDAADWEHGSEGCLQISE